MAGMVAVTYTGLLVRGGNIDAASKGINMCSALFDLEIRFSPDQWVHEVFNRNWPAHIEFEIIHGNKISPETDNFNPYQHLLLGTPANTFCVFYENVKADIHRKFGRKSDFPADIQFCRIVRNAIAHRNKINITDGLAGELNGVTISEKNNGEQLIYNLVTQADLIFLMLILDRHINS